MKRFIVLFAVVCLALSAAFYAGCNASAEPPDDQSGYYPTVDGSNPNNDGSEENTSGGSEENEDMNIIITANGTRFDAVISGAAAESLYARLPLTLDMRELNGNEKYFYADFALPASSFRPGRIEAGDIMLYGNDCIVLFYESFSTSYSYTRIGRVSDAGGLAAALGEGNVTVTFSAA